MFIHFTSKRQFSPAPPDVEKEPLLRVPSHAPSAATLDVLTLIHHADEAPKPHSVAQAASSAMGRVGRAVAWVSALISSAYDAAAMWLQDKMQASWSLFKIYILRQNPIPAVFRPVAEALISQGYSDVAVRRAYRDFYMDAALLGHRPNLPFVAESLIKLLASQASPPGSALVLSEDQLVTTLRQVTRQIAYLSVDESFVKDTQELQFWRESGLTLPELQAALDRFSRLDSVNQQACLLIEPAFFSHGPRDFAARLNWMEALQGGQSRRVETPEWQAFAQSQTASIPKPEAGRPWIWQNPAERLKRFLDPALPVDADRSSSELRALKRARIVRQKEQGLWVSQLLRLTDAQRWELIEQYPEGFDTLANLRRFIDEAEKEMTVLAFASALQGGPQESIEACARLKRFLPENAATQRLWLDKLSRLLGDARWDIVRRYPEGLPDIAQLEAIVSEQNLPQRFR